MADPIDDVIRYCMALDMLPQLREVYDEMYRTPTTQWTEEYIINCVRFAFTQGLIEAGNSQIHEDLAEAGISLRLRPESG